MTHLPLVGVAAQPMFDKKKARTVRSRRNLYHTKSERIPSVCSHRYRVHKASTQDESRLPWRCPGHPLGRPGRTAMHISAFNTPPKNRRSAPHRGVKVEQQ